MGDLPRIARLPYTPNLPNASKRRRGASVRLAIPETSQDGPNVTPRQALPDLCMALEQMAARLALPGRGAPAGGSGRSVGGDEKKGWIAPSADLLRMAVDALPNDQGHFDSRDDWVRLAHAIRGAASGVHEVEGREAWLAFCARWPGASDPDADAHTWDTLKNPHTGWGALMRTLERVNPAGHAAVKAAAVKEAYASQAAVNIAAFTSGGLAPASVPDTTKIPPRPWLYGRSVIGGFVSVLVAPGGQGKSSLAFVEAVAMATGKELLAGEKPVRHLRVWMHSAEDDMQEAQRRLAATLKRHRLKEADLGGRLFLTSGRDRKLLLACNGKDGPEWVPGAMESIVELARERQVNVIVFDPIAAMHSLPENDNAAMNVLLDGLRQIASQTGVGIILLHHTSKAAAMDMDAAGAGASRGASALVDGARVVRQLVRMTTKEAVALGIREDERRSLMRVENGKANLAPAGEARWVRLVSVPLDNGTGDWPAGDWVGVAESWEPSAVQPGSAADLARVQAAIDADPMKARAAASAADWVGWLISDALGLDAGRGSDAQGRSNMQAANFARVKHLLATWLRDGSLIKSNEHDPVARKNFDFIRTGTPAVLAGEADPGTRGEGAQV